MQFFAGQCDIGNQVGEVYEYAPAGYEALDFQIEDTGVDITLDLDESLEGYFFVVGTKLLVDGSINITRANTFPDAAVTCSYPGMSGAPVSTFPVVIKDLFIKLAFSHF